MPTKQDAKCASCENIIHIEVTRGLLGDFEILCSKCGRVHKYLHEYNDKRFEMSAPLVTERPELASSVVENMYVVDGIALIPPIVGFGAALMSAYAVIIIFGSMPFVLLADVFLSIAVFVAVAVLFPRAPRIVESNTRPDVPDAVVPEAPATTDYIARSSNNRFVRLSGIPVPGTLYDAYLIACHVVKGNGVDWPGEGNKPDGVGLRAFRAVRGYFVGRGWAVKQPDNKIKNTEAGKALMESMVAAPPPPKDW